MSNKQDLVRANENELVEIVNKKGVELGVEKLLQQNMALLPKSIATNRIINAAGFYIANNKDLMALPKEGKLQMLYGVLKEATVGLEAGLDYDILLFKSKPTVCRNKNGWYKIIEMIKPAEIVKFVSNVATTDDEISFDPVTETIRHIPSGERGQQRKDIIAAYAFIKFSNGFEKAVFMDKNDITHLWNLSPSKNSDYSPWNAHSIKMVKTKAVKELAKELFTIFSGRLTAALQQAVEIDEQPISRIDSAGIVVDDAPIPQPKPRPQVQIIDEEPIDADYSDVDMDEETGEVLGMDDLP